MFLKSSVSLKQEIECSRIIDFIRILYTVDEGTSPQHMLRIKFQASKEQKYTRDFSTMTVEDSPRIFNFPKNSNLDRKDVEAIRSFIVYNKDLQNLGEKDAKSLASYMNHP